MTRIEFEGTVKFCDEYPDAVQLAVEVEDGGKYPSKARVRCAGMVRPQAEGIKPGEKVSIMCDRLPYGKERTYTDRDGNDKTIIDMRYEAASVQRGTYTATITAESLTDDIPF